MIIVQSPYKDENNKEHFNLVRHYSDEGKQILQKETGIVYDEAIDIIPCRYTYEETDTYIVEEE
ncbi:MAG: hypothetical protein U0M06_14115 [Clostridia bacterium]|nr:hypothetical protein [Clostridia bacterium]